MIKWYCDACKKEVKDRDNHHMQIKEGVIFTVWNMTFTLCSACETKFYALLSKFGLTEVHK
jgi:hypothetical protein